MGLRWLRRSRFRHAFLLASERIGGVGATVLILGLG